MQVTFLGTGTSGGVPMAGCRCKVCHSQNPKDKRLRSSILIQAAGKNLVVDSGPDFRQQMLREQAQTVDAIIYTHSHRDHTAGLDDIRGYNYVMQKAMPLYMNQETLNVLKRHYEYIFNGTNYPGIPQVDVQIIGNSPFQIGAVEFIPIEVLHYQMPVFGYRIADFTYITDANFISQKEMEKVRGSRVIIINALRKETHISHFNLKQALEIIAELKPEKAFLTHISHQLGFHEEVSKELPENTQLAFDGLRIEL